MLFILEYVDHTVVNLHKYLKHTILEVCLKPNGQFNIQNLHVDFQPIVLEIASNRNDYLKEPIEKIYNICQTLSSGDLQLLKDAFIRNNDIENLCDGNVTPILYEEIEVKIDPKINSGEKLSIILKDFCKNLFKHVINLNSFSSRNGKIDDHYDAFMRKNSSGICPFCGLVDIKSDLLSKRDAYDHYLPKDSYPFNTVNFENLIPACNTCNSSYKLANDPISKGLRKAFYPFSKINPNIEIKVKISYIDFQEPKKNIVTLNITSNYQDKVDAWRETYGIDERYNDKCRSDESRYWINQIFEFINYGLDVKSYFPIYITNRKKTPFLEKNFLRVPFLEECMAVGIFG